MSDKSKQYLFVINDSPYHSERPYNALRHARELSKAEGVHVRIYLIGDAVQCAVAGQETPAGFYNVERMMSSLVRRGEVAT